LLPHVSLGSALVRIDAGKSPSGEDRVPGPDERAVLKINAVERGQFRADAVKTVGAQIELPLASAVHMGDVLMVRCNGVLERVGDVCQVPFEPERLFLCDKTLRLVPDADTLLRDYLSHVLASPRSRAQIEERTTGSDMRNIGQRAIREVEIPLPGVDQQRELAAALSAYRAEQSALTEELAALRTARSTLLTALLSQQVEIPESYDDLLDAS
jgi:type I restriction enzyme, S subunit